MPKVTEKYLADKKEFILGCAGEILKEKPLYLITMRDIIKKANFSQGAIYRYYADVEEIYVEYINRNTPHTPLEREVDTLIHSGQPAETILSECILAIGAYIEELLTSVGGRTCFELIVSYAYDSKKRATVFPQLKFKLSLEQAKNIIVKYIMDNVENGIWAPTMPTRSIVAFIDVFIDGIAQSAATGVSYSSKNDSETMLDTAEMFKILAQALVNFLSSK